MPYNCIVPKEVVEEIRKGESFLLAAHVGVDGDHLGSMLALARALRGAGKEVCAYLPEEVPHNYSFLSDLDLLCRRPPQEHYDIVITLECPELHRLPSGINLDKLAQRGARIINIDHHPDNAYYGDVNWVEPDVGALAEMVFDLLKALDYPLDKEMATALYTAILTDTGSFQYSRVTPNTHLKLARLLEFKLPTDDISRMVLRDIRLEVVKLLAKLMSRIELAEGGLLAFAELTLSELKQYQVDDGEIGFFIDEIDRIKGPEVVAIFKELPEERVKVSLRSRRPPVNLIAAQFGGGGHSMAAGCVVQGSLSAVRNRVVKALIESLSQTI